MTFANSERFGEGDLLSRDNQIDLICDAFESSWQHGDSPEIEDYLEEIDPTNRSSLLSELVKLDATYRMRDGQKLSIQEYTIRFPSHSDVLTELGSDFPTRVSSRKPSTNVVAGLILQEQVGAGGFGTVWRAWDEELQRTVAVKLPSQELADEHQRRLFLGEARAAARLHHPGIVAVHRYGEESDQAYIVSQFVEGTTLRKRQSAEPYSPKDAAELVAQVSQALQHAHDAKVLHRDLKPSNILIDDSGKPYIADFGLAKRLDATSTIAASGRMLGTLTYMSPEQAKGQSTDLDGRSDVYSLGVILYELLCGKVPFTGDPAVVLQQIFNDEPEPPRKRTPKVPKDLETICLKALAKQRQDRYPSAGELGEDLKRFLENKPIQARPVSPMGKFWRRLKRQPALGITSVTVAAIASGMIALAAQTTEPPRDGKWEVQIQTEPPGAQVLVFPRDQHTDEPIATQAISIRGRTPTSARLPPGGYFVVATLPDTKRFHEVHRYVPDLESNIPVGATDNQRWEPLSENVIRWPVIAIPSAEVATGLEPIPGTQNEPFQFPKGHELTECDSPRTVNDLLVAADLFTNEDFLARYPHVAPDHQARLASPKAAFIPKSLDYAIHYCEKAGGRLMFEREYEHWKQHISAKATTNESTNDLNEWVSAPACSCGDGEWTPIPSEKSAAMHGVVRNGLHIESDADGGTRPDHLKSPARNILFRFPDQHEVHFRISRSANPTKAAPGSP